MNFLYYVEVRGENSRPQEENVAKAVGAISSEVSTIHTAHMAQLLPVVMITVVPDVWTVKINDIMKCVKS